jgi:hypothetical protein
LSFLFRTAARIPKNKPIANNTQIVAVTTISLAVIISFFLYQQNIHAAVVDTKFAPANIGSLSGASIPCCTSWRHDVRQFIYFSPLKNFKKTVDIIFPSEYIDNHHQ